MASLWAEAQMPQIGISYAPKPLVNILGDRILTVTITRYSNLKPTKKLIYL